MDVTKTRHGCSNNKGVSFYFSKVYNILLSSFRESLFLINSLNVRECGCLTKLGCFLTSSPSRILPLYLVEGSKGALHGGKLLSVPWKSYATIDLFSNEPESAVYMIIHARILGWFY